MDKIIHKTGAIEIVPNQKEAAIKAKHKGKKAEKDFTQKEINELVVALAKLANLI